MSITVEAPETMAQTRIDSPQRLVFHRYGNQYFLPQVWLSQGGNGRGLYPSKAERQQARQVAKNKARPGYVEITARAN